MMEQHFFDEEFRDFVNNLSNVFESNHDEEGVELWWFRHKEDKMEAKRYAYIPDNCHPPYVFAEGEVAFRIEANRKEMATIHPGKKELGTEYVLFFGNPGFRARFDSLEALIEAILGIAKSLRISSQYVCQGGR